MTRPRVVITGGAGFIRSHVADTLVDSSDVAVDYLKAAAKDGWAALSESPRSGHRKQG